ncbi:MAG: hypothetical protein K2J11_05665, partial [Oscillospiraceae bacterium]|nr:hypothetical protein [Oscillospiraceae bacterium]
YQSFFPYRKHSLAAITLDGGMGHGSAFRSIFLSKLSAVSEIKSCRYHFRRRHGSRLSLGFCTISGLTDRRDLAVVLKMPRKTS